MAGNRLDTRAVNRTNRLGQLMGLMVLILLWLMTIGFMFFFRTAGGPALLLTVIMVGMAIVRPRVALAVVIVAGVLGDTVSTPWWPATKNLSSSESILFVSDALTIKPVDIVLAAIMLTLLVNRFLTPGAKSASGGPLAAPVAVFALSIAFGLAWGIGRGGDIRIAYFESVPLLYIPLVYVLAINLFTSLAHYRRLLVGIMAALTLESLYIIAKLEDIRQFIGPDQSAFEHSAAIHFNLALLLTVAVGWFGAKQSWPRPILLLAALPIAFVYVDGQRRAGIVALVIGVTVLAWILFTRDKPRFMRTIPLLAVVGAIYTVAFWGSTGRLGFPAQAIKSVIQPASASESDTLSDLYRDLENMNLNATIRSNPLFGVGFGNEFLKPLPLPDIGAFFEFADYIPHNIVLWIWAKTGILGFLSFFYTSGLAIATGVRAAVRLERRVDVAVMSCFVAYIPMTIVVAFVDISIDPTTLMLFGLSLAAASSAEQIHLAEQSVVETSTVDVDVDVDVDVAADLASSSNEADRIESGVSR